MNEIITEKNYPIQKLWILKSILGSLIALIFFIFYFFLGYINKTTNNSKNIFSALLILILISTIFRFIVAILKRASFHYAVEEKFLTLKQGILSKQQRDIPYGVIQNLLIKQDLFDRIFGLASLTIENASQGGGALGAWQSQKVFWLRIGTQQRQQTEIFGFSGNKVNIPGLTKENAEILKGIILQKIKENPIEDSQSGL
jgi:uncharacterized membrane protein YdbT with pleckstrin-like domain